MEILLYYCTFYVSTHARMILHVVALVQCRTLIWDEARVHTGVVCSMYNVMLLL